LNGKAMTQLNCWLKNVRYRGAKFGGRVDKHGICSTERKYYFLHESGIN
jgi:hypothetical protein